MDWGQTVRKQLDMQPVDSGFEGGWESLVGSQTIGVYYLEAMFYCSVFCC